MTQTCKICWLECDKKDGEFLGDFFICNSCLGALTQIVREKRGIE